MKSKICFLAMWWCSPCFLPLASSSVPADDFLRCVDDDPAQAFCLPADYAKQDRPNRQDDTVMYVDTGFIIDDVSDVDDDSCAVTLVLIMKFSWREDRLVVDEAAYDAKLKRNEKVLELHFDGKNSLWIPDLYISNLRTLTNTGFLDHPGVKIDIAKDKTVYYSRYAQVTFLCPMEFDSFPFDVHVCNFKVHSLEDPESALRFQYQPNTTGVAWKTQTILEHRVSFETLEPDERVTYFTDLDDYTATFSAIGVRITLRRKYLPFIIDFYLPTGLFVVVSWVSFLVPPTIVPGRMALLVTLFLMMVNISTSATSHSPKSDQINGLQIWLLTCIMFVFLALLEYATILYLKSMRGVQRRVFKAGILVVTPPSKGEAGDTCWVNQQTENLEQRIKVFDFACIVLFPFMFAAFNVVYWSIQYAKLYSDYNRLHPEEEIAIGGGGGGDT